MPTITLPPWARYLILSLIIVAAAAYHTVASLWPGSIAAHIIAGVVEAVAGLAVLFGVRSPPAAMRHEEGAISGEIVKVRSLLPLLLVSSLMLGGCAKFAECIDGVTVKPTQPVAYHVSDDVIDAIDLAISLGYAPDSDGWKSIIGELLKRLGPLAACLLSGAAGDLLGHVDAAASAGGAGPSPLSACRACHHAHAPRPEHQPYLRALLPLRQGYRQ